MADKKPIRAVFNAQNVATGLAEFQSGDTVGLTHGGLGASLTIGGVGQVLKVNSAGNAIEFGDVSAILNIDAMTDGSGITIVDGDLFAISDGGVEKKVTAAQIGSYISADIGAVTLDASQVLTNKTLTSAILNTGVSGTAIKDEDDMSSNSNTHLATQQSIKAYVDSEVASVSGSAITQGDSNVTVADSGTGNVTIEVDGTDRITTVAATTTTATGHSIVLGAGSTTTGGSIKFLEGTDNGTNAVTLQGPASTADVTIALPNSAGTVALTSDIPSAGISSGNVATFTSGAVDNDFLRIDGTSIEGRSASEVLSDIGAQASLTFGISNTNAVKIDSASVADDEFARFTASGLESRSTTEVRGDLGLATGDSPQFTAINLGHASDTTIARSSSGIITVEGVEVTLNTTTQTLTNKTLNTPEFTGTPVATQGIQVKNGSTSAGFIEFFEDSDNGTNKVTLIGPASTADVTVTLPTTAGTIPVTAMVSGDATQATSGAITLATVNSNVGSFGSSTAIPVVTVNAKGLVTAVSTASISSSLTIAADSGSNDTVTVGTDTLTFAGTSNEINTTVSDNQIQIGLPDDVTITGNLTVNGTTTTLSTTNTTIEDNLIELNNGASSNSNDSGIVIERGSTGDNAIIMWDESDDEFVFGTTTATGTTTGNITHTKADLNVAKLTSTSIELGHASDTTLTRASSGDVNIEGNIVYRAGGTDVPVADGGTGTSTLTDGGVLLGSGTGAITAMAVLADGEMIVGDGSGDPVPESGATLRTTIGVGTGDSPQFTAIELGHASDTTIARSSSGVVTIEGVEITTNTATQTLTNKTLTTPTITTPLVNAGLQLKNGATSAGFIEFFEDSDNGTNKVTLIGPASTSDVTVTLPASADTLVGKATTDTLTNKSIDLANNTLTGSLSEFNSALQSDSFVSLTGSETLTNKILTSPTLTTPLVNAGLQLKNGATSAGFIEFFEDSDNGTNKVTLIGPASTGDVTLTLPAATDTLIGKATTDTLTNKTFDVEGTGNSISNIDVADFKSGVLDTDLSSVSGSDDTLASAKAIKAYVDAQLTASDLDFQGDSGGALSIDLDSETLDIAGGTGIDTSGSGNTLTVAIDSTVATLTGSQTLTNKTLTTPIVDAGLQLKNGSTSAGFVEFFEDSDNGTNKLTLIGPASTGDVTLTLPSATDTLVGKATTDTLTNKTIDLDNNTVSNIEVDNFKASAIVLESEGIGSNDNDTTIPTSAAVKDYVDTQITAEDLDFQADSGGALSIDLDSETLTFTGGTGIDTSGSGNAVTFAIDSTVATLTGSQTLANKTLTTPIANAGIQLKNGATSAGFLEFFEDSDNGTNKVTLIGPASTGDVTLTLPSATDTLIGKATTDTLTNKTFDAEGTGNSLSNVDVANFKAAAIVTESEGIGSNDNDTSLPTSAAVKDYVDTQITAEDLDVTTDSGTIAIDLDSETMTIAGGEGIDTSATGNTVTIAGEDASTSNKGVASFSSTFFSTSSGAVSLKAAQTGITSLLATDIKIGEDDQTKIDFETANEIHFYANNAEQVFVNDGVFGPQTDSDVDLGTTGVRFKDAYIDSITTTGNVSAETLTSTVATGTAPFTVSSTTKVTNLNADKLDGINSGAFLRSNADDTATGNITFNDDVKVKFGTSGDLEIYHDGSDSYITDGGTGNLKIGGSQVDILGTSETMAKFIDDGAVELYHNNSKKFETTSTGATVTGELKTTTLEIGGTDVTATATELNHVDGVTSAIQTQLDAKQATITGAATTIDDADLTASRALVSDSSGKVAVSAVTSTELGHLDGVTSAIQTQFTGAETRRTNNIAGAISTVTTSDLTASRALVSGSGGKIEVSAITSTEIGHLDGIDQNINSNLAALAAGIAGASVASFPTGDYGLLDNANTATDSFGQTTGSLTSFDMLTTPSGSLATEDLGALT